MPLAPWYKRIIGRVNTNNKSNNNNKLPPIISKSKLALGLVLAGNAGFVNGACLTGALGASQSVAAVTASWTHAAIAAQAGHVSQLAWLTGVIGSYMGGSAVAGYLWKNDQQQQDDDAHSLRPLAAAAALLVTAARLLTAGNRVGLLACAAAVGLQNSVSSTLTGNLCRTAHFSGMTSDMGTLLGQWLRQGKAAVVAKQKLPILAALTACFWTGGYVAASTVQRLGTKSLLLPAAVYLAVLGVHEAYLELRQGMPKLVLAST